MAQLDPARESPAGRPLAVAPLDQERLDARSETKRMRKRARRLARPAYIYTDASFKGDIAGLAYASGSLGDRVAVITTQNSTEAEFWAMVMAMYDAERALGFWPRIVFRTDCQGVALYTVAKDQLLTPPRAHMEELLERNPLWSVQLVKRGRNKRANALAREALAESGTRDDLQRDALLGRH